jgi:hypothetical protein
MVEPADRDPRYWPAGIRARPDEAGTAMSMLEHNIRHGATIAAIGPMTNLALLEAPRPGVLADARIVAMAGWVDPPTADLPAWGPQMDWNVQWDQRAAATVLRAAGDLLNFHCDPVTCAVAAGWPGARTETIKLAVGQDAGAPRAVASGRLRTPPDASAERRAGPTVYRARRDEVRAVVWVAGPGGRRSGHDLTSPSASRQGRDPVSLPFSMPLSMS